MGPSVRIRIIYNRFIAGHSNCALRRHLDSVPPETPIRDIVDRCRVWESHADPDDRTIVKPAPERARLVYALSEPALGPADQVVAAVTGTSVNLADLKVLLRCLLRTALAPPPRPASTRIEAMLKRLL